MSTQTRIPSQQQQWLIPSQQQQWPGSDADLEPRADHGEQSWTPGGQLTGKKAP